ncbi:MAG: hypothetical protein HY608_02090 [Planctomycetes bacterium]|nr:hypothetical protein [Planctomycetota bacterium]
MLRSGVPNFTKAVPIPLQGNPELNERWVQDRIAEDPSILGLGEVVLKARERSQPGAGRLDLLLEDADGEMRYKVEIQLGGTNASHIIRTLEYWDAERRRYREHNHCAVLVAEDVTSRFQSVIGLFNGAVPIIAIQMKAFQVGDWITLVFTKVLDVLSRGIDDDEVGEAEVTDRGYWERKGSRASLEIVDGMFGLLRDVARGHSLKYTKNYIGMGRDGQPDNFVVFKPRRNSVLMELRLAQDAGTQEEIDAAGLDMMDYKARSRRYRIRLGGEDLARSRDALLKILRKSYESESRLEDVGE